jgi:hypothetical protein
MCNDGCDFAFFSFPPVAGNQQLELTEPLHFIVNECGHIRTDTAAHGVRNGTLACAEDGKECLEIELKLVLPLSVGCSLITIITPPVLKIEIDGNSDATLTNTNRDCHTPNVIFYTYLFQPADGEAGTKHCLTSISFDNTAWGEISLGCSCDQHDECQKVPTSLSLVGSKSVSCKGAV